MPSVSEAIEFRQREYGWTAEKMAKALGLTSGHYSELMHGKRRLPYRAACRAFALGVPAHVLLDEKAIRPKRANVYGDRKRQRTVPRR
ncbi:MAG: hypothetical protein IPO08_24890 [Xanthomonadales bacterium]|jgi:transcriptional regulator with XRE-family HTH domain|nr:hypothetical protein [Xanthomonadales bacterium]MBK9497688.1 hypothetical protein [Xanthomonadales bacterium]